MLTTPLLSGLDTPTTQEARRNERIEEQFAEFLRLDEPTPEAELTKFTKKGVASLIEAKIDQLKKKLTEQAMAARGINQEGLDAMDEDTRVTTMADIMKEVEEELKQLVADMFKRDMEAELKRKKGVEFVFRPLTEKDTAAELLKLQETLSSST